MEVYIISAVFSIVFTIWFIYQINKIAEHLKCIKESLTGTEPPQGHNEVIDPTPTHVLKLRMEKAKTLAEKLDISEQEAFEMLTMLRRQKSPPKGRL
jgi:hypothetical protein